MSSEQKKVITASAFDRAGACRAELEKRFAQLVSDPMMQALFDAVLAWMIQQDAGHETSRNSETH